MQLRATPLEGAFSSSASLEAAREQRHEAEPCKHCGTPLSEGDEGPFCCVGCATVYGFLTSEHLERYYDLRGERGQPARDAGSARGAPLWLEPISARLGETSAAKRVELDIQGLHCTACVWLVERLAKRHEGALSLVVDPSVGRLHLVATKALDLPAFVADVERFGYRLGPPLKDERRRSSDLVIRMGLTIALAMNAMIFSIASYAGLAEGPTFVLFERVTFGISTLSVLIGGPVFFRSAFRALRAGVLHMDLPIALGIVLAYGGSLLSFMAGRTRGVFVDTLDVFIALMLVGRFLQERALERNRLSLLASDGVEGLRTRRVEGVDDARRVVTIRATELRKGDVVHLAPGEVLPVDATLDGDSEARFSLDWVNGESEPHGYAPGALIPAGAFLAADTPRTLTTRDAFADSPLVDLLRTPEKRANDDAMSLPFWDTLARRYVAAVLVAASVGFLAWLYATHDVARSLEIATAVLIVTCPCAFGIATPLGYDLVQSGLRRAGLFVRSAGFLDRAALVKTVVFDKTGTLTTGTLTVASSHAFDGFDEARRTILASLASASSHPKAVAVREAMAKEGFACALASDAREEPGLGVERTVAGHTYRMGLASWAAPEHEGLGDVVFGVDGEPLASFVTEEALRKDARTEVKALERDGLSVFLLSGDEPARVAQTARIAGIPEARAFGGRTAEGKAEWVAAHDRKDLLMVGDGINDALVVARAFCGGTPAVDRPFMAARSDFYFTTPGLLPIRLALRAARALASVRRRNLAIALAYNLLCVSLAYAGLLSPLACAVLMPVSSLTAILSTTLSLSPKSSLWKSSSSKSS